MCKRSSSWAEKLTMLTRPQAPPRREEWGFLCFFFFNPNALKKQKISAGSHRGRHSECVSERSHRWWCPCRWSFCRIVERCCRRRWLWLQPGGDTQLKRPSSGNSPPDTAEGAVTSPITHPVPSSHEEHRGRLADRQSITSLSRHMTKTYIFVSLNAFARKNGKILLCEDTPNRLTLTQKDWMQW